MDEIESQVFSGADEDHTERIYKLKREVAEFRRAALPLDAPLKALSDGNVAGTPASSRPYFRDVHDHLLRARDAIEAIDRLLTDILQANLARVGVRQNAIAVRQNEDMRKISAWAAIALVPTAIAGIYGMNFDNMPELRWRYGYFAVLAVISTAVSCCTDCSSTTVGSSDAIPSRGRREANATPCPSSLFEGAISPDTTAVALADVNLRATVIVGFCQAQDFMREWRDVALAGDQEA